MSHSTYSNVVRTALFLVGMLVFGILTSWFVLPSKGKTSNTQLVFNPANINVYDPIFEPDTPSYTLTIANTSRGPIILKGITGSCGCMNLTIGPRKDLHPPLSIEPDTELPVTATIATANRIGPQRYEIIANYESGGISFRSSANINLLVNSGWRAVPHELVCTDLEPGETRTEIVNIYDTFPDPGLQCKEVRSSAIEKVQATFAPLGEKAGEVVSPLKYGNSTITIKPRFRLLVNIRAPLEEPKSSANITVLPADPKRLPLTIPVILQNKTPEITVQPSYLFVDRNATDHGQKQFSILCQSKSEPIANIAITPDQPFIKLASIKKIDQNTNQVKFTIDTNGTVVPRANIKFQSSRSDANVVLDLKAD